MNISYRQALELACSEIARCQHPNDKVWTIKMLNEDYNKWIEVAKTDRNTALRFCRKFIVNRAREIYNNARGGRETYQYLLIEE